MATCNVSAWLSTYCLFWLQGYKVELASKQLTMDFVNQSVLQPGPHEIEHEKLDYAEKLAELNQHWTKVDNPS